MAVSKHDFIFSGYTLCEALYNQVKKISCMDKSIKDMFLDETYYICGVVVTNNPVDYVKVKEILEKLENIDLDITPHKEKKPEKANT